MLLLICSTENEYAELVKAGFADNEQMTCHVCGVGPVETTLALSSLLSDTKNFFSQVILFGVGGAYRGSGLGLLDICVANQEILGDLGFCQGEGTQPFENVPFAPPHIFPLASVFLSRCQEILSSQRVPFRTGSFVTVSSASSTLRRGDFFFDRYGAICENMEGAAAARVCQHYSMPFFELRAISNIVEDRDQSTWQVQKAATRAAISTVLIVRHLLCH